MSDHEPSEHDTRSEGVVAFLGGLTLADNPHPDGTAAARGWAEGWRSAGDADDDDPSWR